MPEPRDFLPAPPPYPPLPQGLINYLTKAIAPKIFYAPGDIVNHWNFGEGKIISYKVIDHRWVVDIEFIDPQYGTKTFFAEVPYLSKEDIPKLTLR